MNEAMKATYGEDDVELVLVNNRLACRNRIGVLQNADSLAYSDDVMNIVRFTPINVRKPVKMD